MNENFIILMLVLFIVCLIAQGLVISWIHEEIKRIRWLLAIMAAERSNSDKNRNNERN